MFAPTDWVSIDAVARLYPQTHGARLPYMVITRDGGRQATVGALAHALGIPSRKLQQALVAEELRRLGKGAR